MKKIVIAVDGFSSCGKSTMAKDLAKEIGYTYIDSGAMYRAVTLYAIENNMIIDNRVDEEALKHAIDNHLIHITFELNPKTEQRDTFLNGNDVESLIRSMQVASKVSIISAIKFVRQALVAMQQEMGQAKGVVMDGRDIGTAVFPNAELKIFVTASAEVRAQRRVDELVAKGSDVSFEEVLQNVKERDLMDTTRTESPLRKADDALELDNSHLSIAEQKAWLLEQFNNVVKS